MSEKATLAQRLIEFARLQEERECGEAHIHSKNMRAIWDECVQETEKAEAALAAVTKERDEAVGHLRNALFGPGEPPPCDCDEDVMHEHILQWNRLSDRARDWLVARDAEKEGK